MLKNKVDHLLATLGEECGEVQQSVGKALRFGLFEHNPKTQMTHWVSLRNEVHDLIAVYEMLCDDLELSSEFDREKIENKIHKVNKYYTELQDKE
jgi:NTP pyrophosphatase (non-canonical NTP hydrolase)